MGLKPACLLLALLLAGCALTRPPPACRGPLQPINAEVAENANAPA